MHWLCGGVEKSPQKIQVHRRVAYTFLHKCRKFQPSSWHTAPVRVICATAYRIYPPTFLAQKSGLCAVPFKIPISTAIWHSVKLSSSAKRTSSMFCVMSLDADTGLPLLGGVMTCALPFLKRLCHFKTACRRIIRSLYVAWSSRKHSVALLFIQKKI